jgi:hypothetical protein
MVEVKGFPSLGVKLGLRIEEDEAKTSVPDVSFLGKKIVARFESLTKHGLLTEVSCNFSQSLQETDRRCGLVVRVPGYRSRGSGFDFRRYQIF